MTYYYKRNIKAFWSGVNDFGKSGEKLCLRPDQQITLLERDDMITAIPDQRLEKFRGILKGMSRIHLRE